MFFIPVGFVLGAALSLGYAYREGLYNKKNVLNVVQQGYCPPPTDKETKAISRPDVEKVLRSVLCPKKGEQSNMYYLVTGEHGTGKTTIVRKVCREADGGVIYIDVPDYAGLVVPMLASALRYDLDEITFVKAVKHKTFEKPIAGKSKSSHNVDRNFF